MMMMMMVVVKLGVSKSLCQKICAKTNVRLMGMAERSWIKNVKVAKHLRRKHVSIK